MADAKVIRRAAPDGRASVRAVESDAALRMQELEIRRSALALAASIARKHGLDACPTCGRKAA